MAMFKTGDKVRVLECVYKKHVGKEGVIVGKSSLYDYKVEFENGDTCGYDVENIELVKERKAKEHKFKVGDRVKVIKCLIKDSLHTNHVGEITERECTRSCRGIAHVQMSNGVCCAIKIESANEETQDKNTNKYVVVTNGSTLSMLEAGELKDFLDTVKADLVTVYKLGSEVKVKKEIKYSIES